MKASSDAFLSLNVLGSDSLEVLIYSLNIGIFKGLFVWECVSTFDGNSC